MKFWFKKNARLISVLLLALVVRLLGITSRPMWYDEAFAILFSEKGLGAMMYGTLAPGGVGSSDIHPLGYYTLLWGWMKLFGSSLLAARSLSVLAGLCLIYIAYRLTRELFNEQTAFIAGLFVALAPFQVHYSQEIRMYAFLAMWLVAATYAYWQGSRTEDWRWWGVFAITCALAQYTHNLAAFYLIPLALTPVLQRDWRSLRATVLAGFAAVILYTPWLIQLPAQFAKVSNSYWVEKPGAERFFTLLLTFTSFLPLPGIWLIFALFSATLVVTLAIWQTIRAYSQSAPMATRGIWVFYLAVCPAVLLFLFSQWKPVYIERALLPSGVIFCVWLAWSLTINSSRPTQYILLLLLATNAGLGLYQRLTYSGFPYAPYQEMDHGLRKNLQPGDVIIHSNKLSLLPAIYFDRELPQSYIIDAPGSPTDTLLPATQEVLGLNPHPNLEIASRGAEHVWFIIFRESIEEFTVAGAPTHPHLAWLNDHFELDRVEEWGSLLVYLYSKHQ